MNDKEMAIDELDKAVSLLSFLTRNETNSIAKYGYNEVIFKINKVKQIIEYGDLNYDGNK